MRRRTVAREIEVRGTGLHSGKTVSLLIRPGRSGIVFIRDSVRIPAVPGNVVDTRLNTTVGAGGVSVSTIEHVMASLWGLSVTDCDIEADGPEMPVLDGSALPYCTTLREAGFRDLQPRWLRWLSVSRSA
jgi:UDP-3-O-[3-hydroxymyristoyl] N-acetylglucosamine deacetylase